MSTHSHLDISDRYVSFSDAHPPRRRAEVDVDIRHPDGEHAYDIPCQQKGGVRVHEGGQQEEAQDVHLRFRLMLATRVDVFEDNAGLDGLRGEDTPQRKRVAPAESIV